MGFRPQAYEVSAIPFGEWMPDLMDLNNPGVTDALNVLPIDGGYSPFRGQSSVTDLQLPAACRGGIAILTNDDVRLYAGTRGGLYARQGNAFVTKWSKTGEQLSDYHRWAFVEFGDNVVALHPQVKPLKTTSNTNADFEEVDGDPPRAYCGARVKDFLVLGNLEENAEGYKPNRIRWSAFNNIDLPWISSQSTQADYQDMPSEGGAVMAIAGREFGTIFQERLISRMTYEGGTTIFSFETVEDERGSICTHGVVDQGGVVYFIAHDGFYAWNGVNSTPIGNNKVNKWFYEQLNYGARSRIVGAVDPQNGCIIWAFPTTTNALDTLIIYSYKENRWSRASLTVEHLFQSAGLGASLDDLTDDLDVDYTTSFDDPIYKRGRPVLAGFNSAHVYGTFTGDTLAASIETAEYNGPQGRRVSVVSATPLVDLAHPVASMKVAIRDQLYGEGLVYGDRTLQEVNGECPVLADGHALRFRVEIPACANWSHAVGVDVKRRIGGAR